eukprot:CAMPEP_0115518478 /NCGR_PEP_ID=MMETSP0271-20121206/77903_1 /TAXON_ID=71861 /ORGANISM="Scrippsiella trochoidea, Strain CCMP3099" /LENGTH=72 /DNA_ID=CAMNT_0002949383 /DNA_START=57 /DNA_END=272 /DNA_ORIENTATION=+
MPSTTRRPHQGGSITAAHRLPPPPPATTAHSPPSTLNLMTGLTPSPGGGAVIEAAGNLTTAVVASPLAGKGV